MKRILCILDSLNAGGAETFLMKVARTIPAEECQFDFIVSHAGGTYAGEILARGGKIHKIPTRHEDLWGALRGIRNIVKENGYDRVLKLGNTPIAAIDLVAAKLGGASVLAMRSCNALTGLSRKERAVNAALRPLLNAVAHVKLAPSMLAAEFTFGRKQARERVCLLHNGVDLGRFGYREEGRRSIRQEFSLKDRLVVGHIGRFHKQKNHAFLLEVFRQIVKKRPDAALLLVGVGELEDTIRSQAEEMGLRDQVIFAGTRMDIPDVLSAMDVFVFPSFYEGMPNTVIEAQATGLPCILADTITREADITGLVRYLSLQEAPEHWADRALDAVVSQRRNTAGDFLEQRYDIQSVALEFRKLLRL